MRSIDQNQLTDRCRAGWRECGVGAPSKPCARDDELGGRGPHERGSHSAGAVPGAILRSRLRDHPALLE
jgi:hypothetical protein